MRKIILSILAGVLIIGGSLLASNYIIDSKENKRPKPEKVVKTVFIDTVANAKIPIIVPANGSLVAQKRVALFAEVQGIFRQGSHLFRAGQEYKTGQTLIKIDASEYYASVQSAKSDLYNSLTSIMPDLQLDYPEHFQKWKGYLTNFDLEKTTPELPKFDTDKEKFFISGRGIVTSYYNVKNLEQRLTKYTIRAPFNGILTEALVGEGTLVRSGQQLGQYVNKGNFELEVGIGESFGNLLRVGKKVSLNSLDKSKKYEGTVVRVNGAVDQTTQTITAFIAVKGEDLKEGQYLEANLYAEDIDDAIKIDRSLLVNNKSLFVVVKDSVLDLVDVSPVFFGEKDAVVKDVPNGTLMVSKPLSGAYVGMKVKIHNQEKGD